MVKKVLPPPFYFKIQMAAFEELLWRLCQPYFHGFGIVSIYSIGWIFVSLLLGSSNVFMSPESAYFQINLFGWDLKKSCENIASFHIPFLCLFNCFFSKYETDKKFRGHLKRQKIMYCIRYRFWYIRLKSPFF